VSEGESLEQAINLVLDQGAEGGLYPPGEAEDQIRRELTSRLRDLGPLQPLLEDPSIEEIWINSDREIFVASSGVSRMLPYGIEAPLLSTLVEKMLRHTGRRLDRSSPFVDASLPDGSRLHVVIPDITRDQLSLNIRKFPSSILSLTDLVALGSITKGQAAFLSSEIKAGSNFLVSGATQAGKTTLLCALLNEVSATERIVSVEETFEIKVAAKDWVAMQTRQPNLEGVGEISLRRLVKEALRMRPGRIVVGEVREAESFDLLIALNSGLPGLCTIHANSASDAISKLCTLPLLAGANISSDFVKPTVASCIRYVVHCQMLPSGARRIQEIAALSWDSQQQTIKLSAVQC
jgi:pilus assembly protein CpaF